MAGRQQAAYGGGSVGGSGPSGASAGESEGSGGGAGAAGGGESWAKGGAFRTKGPKRITVGEGGEPEDVIVVPRSMKQPGLQPHEAQVIRAMEAILRQLRASAGRKAEAHGGR